MIYSMLHNSCQCQKLDFDVLYMWKHVKFLFFGSSSGRSQTQLEERGKGRHSSLEQII